MIRKNLMNKITTAIMLSIICTTTVSAKESSFGDGYDYKRTGYTVSTITSDFKYVAKIDCYEYLNLHDIQYCATDAYFYTQSKATGKKVNTSIKGYAVARYEKGTKHDASSGRIYGYGNVEAWSDGCGNWSYDAHYYGTAIK